MITIEFSYILAGLALLCALMTLFVFERPLLRIGNAKQPRLTPVHTPKVSVIVYSQVNEESLLEYLDKLQTQDYPDFEVIVACETSAESYEILAESCVRRYRNVHVTFVPSESHNLSRRKLALTLGMKAATGEIVVTTVANASAPGVGWLSTLVAPLLCDGSEHTDIALGYAHLDYRQMKGGGKWYREFNELITDALWIGYALGGKPYRGDGRNLAFRRKLFFDHKGYSQSIHLHAGDDDIFIHEVSTPQNTAITLDPESFLLVDWGDASTRMWRARKEQYEFTSKWLPRKPFLQAGAVSLMQWLIAALCAASILLSLPSLAPAIVAATVILLFWLGEILIYRRAASRLHATRLWWALPLFRLAKPILNALFRLHHRRHRKQNFTWTR